MKNSFTVGTDETAQWEKAVDGKPGDWSLVPGPQGKN